MQVTIENKVLHPRVKICFILNKYLQQFESEQLGVNSMIKESFKILSKQILAIQMKQRLEGQNSVLELEDPTFYLTEFNSKADYGVALEKEISDLDMCDTSYGDGFEGVTLYKLSTLLNVIKTVLKEGVDIP